tara:strand:+ start:1164 stop:1451 length:288 start_codon:yes stop_codon:yes gene_type:complete
MSEVWYDDIYSMVESDWKRFRRWFKNNDNNKDKILLQFKTEYRGCGDFNLEKYSSLDLMEIQKHLIDNGVEYQYLFDREEIEMLIIKQVVDEFQV